MNFVTRFATVAALIVAANAIAEESASNDARQMLARADLANARVAVDSIALDQYVGRYVADSGVEFIVVEENNGLTIDMPESWGVTESRLRAEDTSDFFVASVSVLVSFDVTADGRVAGLVAYPSRGEAPITAVKMPLRRGVVTIQDVFADEDSLVLATAPTRRGIVTIHDVYEELPSTQIAAATK
jgi:hypothetical protein